MEFLDNILASVLKDPAALIAVALAAFIGALAAAICTGLWRFFFQTVPRVIRYKFWPFLFRLYMKAQIKYRRRRAKRLMATRLRQTPISVHPQTHALYLSMDPSRAGRGSYAADTPETPSWLNDHYVATALEALFREGEIVKANVHGATFWPPEVVDYRFSVRRTSEPVSSEADALETESMCQICLRYGMCSIDARYEYESYSETLSARQTDHLTHVSLKDSAPPCGRCWETETRETDMWVLVTNITRYDLAPSATHEITGENREFQDAVIEVCLRSGVATEAPTVRRIVERGIGIRQEQLQCTCDGMAGEWTEQMTTDFRDAIRAYVQEELG